MEIVFISSNAGLLSNLSSEKSNLELGPGFPRTLLEIQFFSLDYHFLISLLQGLRCSQFRVFLIANLFD